MKNKILALVVLAALLTAALSGCQTTTNSDSGSSGSESASSTETVNESSEDYEKLEVDVYNLSETSEPVGISGFSSYIDDEFLYATGTIINNNDKFEESQIIVYIQAIDSAGESILYSPYEVTQTLKHGETYVFDMPILSLEGDDEGETYNAEIVNITIQNMEAVELENAVYEFADDIDDEAYNSAQLKWERIKETYGDTFADVIEAIEAYMKDEGIDPNNIAAGINAASQPTADSSAQPTAASE